MRYAEIRSLSVTELAKKRKDLSVEMFNIKMKNSIGQANSPIAIRILRREIARVNTAITSKKVLK